MRQIEGANIPSNNIPLMGDAAPGDSDEAILSNTLDGTDLVAGVRLAESFNDGPAYVVGNRVNLVDGGNEPTGIEALVTVATSWPAEGESETTTNSLARVPADATATAGNQWFFRTLATGSQYTAEP
jgi:hypothetical protein